MSKARRKGERSFDIENMRVRAGQFVTEELSGTADVKTATLSEGRAGAKSARIAIDFPLGRASMQALPADSADLFQAQLSYIGEYDFQVRGGAAREISLRPRGDYLRDVAVKVGKQQALYWDIALAPHLPLILQLKGGIGDTEIDLSQLLVDAVKLETGVGTLTIQLPRGDQRFSAEIITGVGKTQVKVPAGANGDLAVRGGLGEFTLLVAYAAALQVRAKTGLGNINMPKTLNRVQAGDGFPGKAGIWETDNFAAARDQIFIDYAGGIGNFNLQFVESG